ncbi:MAG: bluetail domain-containing putative surface protein, partial [Cyanobacteriota bacterium]
VASLLTAATFAANGVAAFTATKQTGTLIAMNDGRPGFQADSDSIILLENYNLSSTNFVEFV